MGQIIQLGDPQQKLTGHFRAYELWDPDTKQIGFEEGFLEDFEQLRIIYGSPINPTSGCRSGVTIRRLIAEGYNPHPNSLHNMENAKWQNEQGEPLMCCAVDIEIPPNLDLFLRSALRTGWSVGMNPKRGFFHLDRRSRYVKLPHTLPPKTWFYKESLPT